MAKYIKNGVTMEIVTEVQAVPFERNGWEKVEAKPEKVEEPESEFPFMNPPEEPKKRGRKPNKQ